MAAKLLHPLALLLLAIPLVAVAQAPPDPQSPEPPDTSSQSAISNGVAAFKAARYDAAVQHFKVAVALDPASIQAQLYLGTAYAYQVVPNLDTPENQATAKLAIASLTPIPNTAPEYLTALRQIATLYRNIGQDAPATAAELHIIQLDPSDAEAHYTLGVLDWQRSYKNAREILAANGLTDDGNGNPTLTRSACLDLRSRNAPLLQDGLDHLTRAIDLRPGFGDAMQYLNLTLRRHADLACGDNSAREEDLAKADQWTQKAMLTRKQNEARKPQPE